MNEVYLITSSKKQELNKINKNTLSNFIACVEDPADRTRSRMEVMQLNSAKSEVTHLGSFRYGEKRKKKRETKKI